MITQINQRFQMKISQQRVILLSSVLLTAFFNFSFFKNVIATYSFGGLNSIYIISMAIMLVALFTFLFSLFSSKYTTKPLLILVFMVSCFTAYFMDTYHVVIDDEMIRNSLQTNLNESSDLFSLKLVAYVIILGLIPSFLIYKTNIQYQGLKKELISKLKTIVLSLVIIAIIVLSFSKFYSSFFREHKPLRYSVNPVYWMYSIGKYISKTANAGPIVVKEIGVDAITLKEPINEKELIIMVVGEAARADRFSLNGYKKETNPLLTNEELINFSNMSSCGTSTAVSVPCMFSIYDKDSYDYKKGISTQNVIDVLKNTKDVSILWRDNNSSSKGVADRIDYEDFRTPKTNSICAQGECRDIGMIVGLEDYIEKNKGKDILIVLHQMGNHGPAYYKRYPKEFEKFTPVCKTNQLEQCTQEEVSNAYDNAILYTDYFLSEVIKFLKPYSSTYETAMLYMSDHGESLGESGLYLHGMPYFMAPKEQTNVASFIWLGDGAMRADYDIEKLKAKSANDFSHDNLFHTLLGLFEVQSEVYDSKMDILYDSRIH
jgi:lipid A ethanolaminephosphotransferase